MQFEKWIPVDLLKPPFHALDIGMPVCTGDSNSVRLGVTVTSNGEPVDVTGTIKGVVTLPNGLGLVPFDGAKEGCRAWIDLPEDALGMAGRITIAIRSFDGGETTVLLLASATVRRVDADEYYDPTDIVGDITDLIADAEQAAQDAADALAQATDIVSYAEQTGKTDAQKAQARTNIGAASTGDVSDVKSAVDSIDSRFDNPNVMDYDTLTLDTRFPNTSGQIRPAESGTNSIIFGVSPETSYYLHIVGGYNRRVVVGNSTSTFTTLETYDVITSVADGTTGMKFTTPASVNYVMIYFYSGSYTFQKSNFRLYEGNAIPADLNPVIHKANLPDDIVYTDSDALTKTETAVDTILYKTESILPNWYFTTDTKVRIAALLERIISGGVFRLAEFDATLRCALQGFDSKSHTTKVFDSGWLTNGTPYSCEINPDLFYQFIVQKNDASAFDSLDDVSSVTLEHIVQTVGAEIATPLTSLTVRSIAHRGDVLSAPQNTAPAYVYARKRGNTIAENDVCVSSDGEYVMWHDTSFALCGNLVDISGYEMYTDGSVFYYYDSENEQLYTYTTDYVESSVSLATLTRCAGANYAPDTLPLSVLKRIDVGAYMGGHFKGTQIQTFAEWILLIKQLGMDGYIDRKMTYTAENIAELAGIVKRYGMLDHVSWIGINTSTIVDALRAVDPNARIGVLEHPNATNVVTYAPFNTGRGYFFDGDAKSGLTEQAVQTGIAAGFEVECYLVGYDYPLRTKDAVLGEILTAISYGVTGITLDYFRVDDAAMSMMNTYHF